MAEEISKLKTERISEEELMKVYMGLTLSKGLTDTYNQIAKKNKLEIPSGVGFILKAQEEALKVLERYGCLDKLVAARKLISKERNRDEKKQQPSSQTNRSNNSG